MVCSMRPMTPENAKKAYDITVKMPNVHGAPVHMGDAAEVGVADVMKPDYGEAVDFYEGEIPVFWPCGVTPQAAVENAKPPIAITHAPRGEICALRWEDFDTKQETLHVRRTLHKEKGKPLTTGDTKTYAGTRKIVLPPSTAQLLRERKKTAPTEWIFPNPFDPEQPIAPRHFAPHIGKHRV